MRSDINNLEAKEYDVVVIGAGAVGCASARELAGRGYETLLLDRSDIGSGTSSRSSRLLYSGVGYLAPHFPLWQIPFRLKEIWNQFLYARNIMHCRAELVSDMPNRLKKRRFYYPYRTNDQYPHWLINFGFKFMDITSSRGVSLNYRRYSTNETKELPPMIEALANGTTRVAEFDEFMYDWPERICVDTALDAERRGATIRTYTKVSSISKEGQLWKVSLEEQAPNQVGQATVKAKAIVNAAGPWVDRVIGGGKETKSRVLGKKGVNLMVKLPENWQGHGLEAFSSKGEPFYIFPWRQFHFIGPTESLVSDDPDTVKVNDSEITYLLNEANLLFPDLKLTINEVLHSWCGVRPMSTLDGTTVSLPVRAIESASHPKMVTITGSYIMMHRHAGRLAAKSIEKWLGKRGKSPQGFLPTQTDSSANRITDIINAEHVVRLSDLIRRRLPDGLDPLNLGRDKVQQMSEIAAQALGWTESQRQEEIQFFLDETESIYRSGVTQTSNPETETLN